MCFSKNAIQRRGSFSYNKRWCQTKSFRITWILGVAGRKVKFSSPTVNHGANDYMYTAGCFKYTKILHSEGMRQIQSTVYFAFGMKAGDLTP